MTDKEIVERAKEAGKKTDFCELVHSPISKGVNSAYGIGFIEGMVEYRNSLQEESVSERFAFKAIPRLLEMIEPTARAKAYTAKLADAFEVEGYSTDAKIVRESIKVMNGEKVPLTTMDDEPVSEDLEEAIGEYCSNPDNFATWIGGKENDDIPLIVKAIKFGANWQKKQILDCNTTLQRTFELGKQEMKQQMMANAIDCKVEWIDGVILDYTQEQQDDVLVKINASVGDKVKVIILKQE